MGLFLKKNHLSRYWDCLFLLNWTEAVILSQLLKLYSTKLKPQFFPWSFSAFFSLSLQIYHAALHGILYCHVLKTIEDYCHVLSYVRQTTEADTAISLEPLVYLWNIISRSLFHRMTLADVHSHSCSWSACYSNRLHDFSVTILDVLRMPLSTISFLSQLDSGFRCLQNALLWPML